MGPMQAVTLDLRHPWFASKAQATGRQNSPPIHDVCRARAARAPVRQPLVGVGRSRSRSHRRRSGSRLFAGFGIVDPAPSFEQ